jgi:tRNA pseudouridine13 synthase
MPFFQIKLRPEDFIVTEILDTEPSWSGDFHYILLEKKWLTTFLLIDLMIKDLWFNKNMIGIAGLKDKNAITRQWISISKRDVAKYVGGVNDLLDWMRQKWKVIKATYGEKMLKLGNNAWNHFDLTLVWSALLMS